MSKFKKVFKAAAPIALNFIPGIGTLGSIALGAGLGALGGGGLKGAVAGGVTGGLGAGGLGSSIARGFGVPAGLAANSVGGAISGAAGGALGGGGVKGAALGAAASGLGSYVSSGGGVPVLGSVGGRLGPGGYGPPTPGTGVLGELSSLTNATATGGAQPLKLGSLLSTGGDALSYFQSKDDIEDIQNMLAQQSQLAQNQFAPYSQAGQQALQNLQAPSLEALQNDPGYQFRLQQGNQALERSLAAQGLGNSGLALKSAQEYGQGLADQTYNDFYNRQFGLAQQGFGAASGLGSLYTNLGNVQAAAELERINQRNNLYSSLGGLFG